MGIYTLFFADAPIQNMKPFFAENQSTMTSVILILAIAPWAYVGFDNIPQAAEEFKFSPSKAFSLIILSLFASGIVYAIMIGVTSWTYSINQISDSSNLWLTGDIINSSFGIIGVVILSIAICMGIFTGLNGFFHSSSRLLFAMGRAKALPSFFQELHPVYKTPYKAILFVAVITLPSVWFGREALLWIVDMSSIGVSVAYFFTCFAAYKALAWSRNTKNISVEPMKKVIAILGSIFSLGFLTLLLAPGSPAQLKMPSLLALIVWIILGFIFFGIMFKKYKLYSQEDLNYYIFGSVENIKTESLKK